MPSGVTVELKLESDPKLVAVDRSGVSGLNLIGEATDIGSNINERWAGAESTAVFESSICGLCCASTAIALIFRCRH